MKKENLKGVKVAILATDGFEQAELKQPRKALEEAGAETRVVSPTEGKIRGWNHIDWGEEVKVDIPLPQANADDFDALLLPGGVQNPDKLRMEPAAVEFAKSFFDEQKPVAAICHGPWLIIEAGQARGREIASWPSLKTDIQNAGGTWVDREVVVGDNLVTSRNPDDIPAFNREMIQMFSEAASREQKAA